MSTPAVNEKSLLSVDATTDIRTTLKLFSTESELVELRALNCRQKNRDFKSTRTGLFEHDKLEEAANHAVGLEKFHNASGVYLTLNPVRRDLLARAANRTTKADRGGTTKDDEIVCRRWMLIDLDPDRPAGVSSTDAELAVAEIQAKECGQWLCDNGWPRPVIAMSGNGWHLLYRVDLPTADKRIEACLQALAAKFPLVDSANHNPARITKLYGTMARKGDSTNDRPHRRSKLVEVPDDIKVVHTDCLDWLAAQAVKKPSVPTRLNPDNAQSPVLERWLHRNGIKVLNREETADATRFFIRCPRASVHTNPNADTDCCVTQDHSGRLGGKCLHNSCGMKCWSDIKAAIGPITSDDFPKAIRSLNLGPTLMSPMSPEGNEATVEIPRSEIQNANDEIAPLTPTIEILSAGQLLSEYTEMRPAIVEGLLRSGEIMNLIASSKAKKSWLVLSLGLSVCMGWKWLGKFWTRQGKVLIVDNELHKQTLACRLKTVAEAMQIPAADYHERLQLASLRGQLVDLHRLAGFLLGLEPGQFDLIILDAFYRFLPPVVDENSNADITALYNLIDSVLAKLGAAVVIVHHTSKGNQSSKTITDTGSGAGAQSRAADTHMTMRPHEVDDVAVIESVTRSWPQQEACCVQWQYPLWVVTDALDPKDLRPEKPRKKTSSAAEGEPSKEERQKEAEAEQLDKILNAYRTFPNGETESVLSESAGVNFKYFRPINAELIRTGRVIPTKVQKSRKEPYPGYRLIDLNGTHSDTPTLRHSDKTDCLSDSSDSSDPGTTHTPTTAPPFRGQCMSECRCESDSSDEPE